MKEILIFVILVGFAAAKLAINCVGIYCEFSEVDEMKEFIEIFPAKSKIDASEKVLEISFKNSKVENLPGKLFETFKDLEICRIENVQLKNLSGENFKSARKLRCLFASNNNLTKLGEKLFENLPSLERIDFSYNQIESINPNAFNENSKHLQLIDLSFNRLKVLKEEILVNMCGQSKNLYLVDLQQNEIVKIEKNSGKSREISIYELRLSGNKLKKFEFNNVKITAVLEIDGNELETLSVFDGLSVSANRNNLKNIFVGRNIRSLKAENNKISTIHCVNCSLEYIYMSGNKNGSEILKSCGSSSNLIEMNLSNSSIKFLPEHSLSSFHSLRRLSLEFNQICFLSDGVFTSQKNLQFLNISHNCLKNLSMTSLSHLTKLNILDISKNHLLTLQGHENFAKTMKNLKYIGIFGNGFAGGYLRKLLESFGKQGMRILKPDGLEYLESYVKHQPTQVPTKFLEKSTPETTTVKIFPSTTKTSKSTEKSLDALENEVRKEKPDYIEYNQQKEENLINLQQSFTEVTKMMNFARLMSFLNMFYITILIVFSFCFLRYLKKFRKGLELDFQQSQFASSKSISVSTLVDFNDKYY